MDLSIIIVNWNSVEYLLDCLHSILEHTKDIVYEVIVIDNASPRDDVGTIRRLCPEIRLIPSETNLGFARANNLGFVHSTGTYVLFLNPDTRLTSPAINVMLSALCSLPDAGIVGCKLMNSDLTVQLSSIQKRPTILNQVLDAEYLLLRWPKCPLWGIAPLFSESATPVKVDVISGACMMLRRGVFEQVGGFSEDYFMYAEDLDLNYKVMRASYHNYYVGTTTIVHYGGKSSSQQPVSQWNTMMKHRAMLRYYRKTRGRFYEALYRSAIGAAAMVRLMALALAYLVGSLAGKTNKCSIRYALAKWGTIFRCMLGWQTLSLPVKGKVT